MRDSLLSQKQAARMLGLSVRTLERHRIAGTGPRFARLGRLVRYRQNDLDQWVESNLRNSTSELSGTAVRQPTPEAPSRPPIMTDRKTEGPFVGNAELKSDLVFGAAKRVAPQGP
jgi:excisionase family DNA binding protein